MVKSILFVTLIVCLGVTNIVANFTYPVQGIKIKDKKKSTIKGKSVFVGSQICACMFNIL